MSDVQVDGALTASAGARLGSRHPVFAAALVTSDETLGAARRGTSQ